VTWRGLRNNSRLTFGFPFPIAIAGIRYHFRGRGRESFREPMVSQSKQRVMTSYLDINQLSAYLGIKSKTLYAWVNQRRIPHKKLGKLVRFDVREIDAWVSANSVKAHDVY